MISSERINFQLWNVDKIDDAMHLWSDPLVTKYIGIIDENRLALEMQSFEEHGVQYWPMYLKSNGAFIGCCGLHMRDEVSCTYELGIHLEPAFWHQGLAAEACRAVITYAQAQNDMHALFAGHNPNNEASRQLLLKLGFVYTHDEYYAATGLEHPSYIMKVNEEK